MDGGETGRTQRVRGRSHAGSLRRRGSARGDPGRAPLGRQHPPQRSGHLPGDHGEDASFYCPFDDASTTGLFGKIGPGLLLSLCKSGAGTSDYRMGFSPMLTAFVPMVGCDFGTAPLSITSGGWQNGG